MSATIEEIKRIISLQLGNREIGDEDRLMEELRAESIDIMNIIVAIEERFRVHIKESVIPEIQTPLAIYNFVKSQLESKP
jgi:acyl carrier protein